MAISPPGSLQRRRSSQAWEIQLAGSWKPLGAEEIAFLEGIKARGQSSGNTTLRGQAYSFDLAKMTQKNVDTGKERSIRCPVPEETVATNAFLLGGLTRQRSIFLSPDGTDELSVEVWLAGEWKRLGADECKQIADHYVDGERVFRIESQTRRFKYEVNLDHMTQTNLETQRTRTIRFAAVGDLAIGFDEFRGAFRKHAMGSAAVRLTAEGLQRSWPVKGSGPSALIEATAQLIVSHMSLRGIPEIDMTEWNHYWALERDSPSSHAAVELNDKLKSALAGDPQVLGRMQMHFETAVGETSSASGLSSVGLVRACERLVASPKDVVEKVWAKEVLQKHAEGEGPDEDVELSYYDFLNMLLGRKRFKVSLWMYDISDGVAERWSWLLLGQSFRGIWHTGVVVEWPDGNAEFWFGGRLFLSVAGTTPFGTPVEKIFLGYTYKLREEVWNKISRHLAHEFTKEKYDVLTHNCNNFSDTLTMFLMNEHIPDEIRKQPEMVMDTVAARALRPLLNRWLGGFGDGDARASDDGEEHRRVWDTVAPDALIEFSREEGGRPFVGQVTEVFDEDCVVRSLDFWRESMVERDVPRELVSKVILEPPPGAAARRPSASAPAASPFFSWCSAPVARGHPISDRMPVGTRLVDHS